jgi:uncharacterized protein YdhG (YjbR/CyaY superfamily)
MRKEPRSTRTKATPKRKKTAIKRLTTSKTGYCVKQIKPLDDELVENWLREISDPKERSIHGVDATKRRDDVRWRWRVSVWAMEHVRDVPLEADLRRRIGAALRAVPGVAEAAEEDREVWVIRGEPEGAALVAAVATAVDVCAEQIGAFIYIGAPVVRAGKPTTIDEYLAGAPSEHRAALQSLRETIQSVVPEAEECISYRIPAFRRDRKLVAGFSATSKGCSYYPFSGSTLKTLASAVAGYTRTKGALHFSTNKPLPATLVRKLIAARIAERK